MPDVSKQPYRISEDGDKAALCSTCYAMQKPKTSLASKHGCDCRLCGDSNRHAAKTRLLVLYRTRHNHIVVCTRLASALCPDSRVHWSSEFTMQWVRKNHHEYRGTNISRHGLQCHLCTPVGQLIKEMYSGSGTMMDPQSPIHDPGFNTHDHGSRIQGPGSRIQGPGSRIQDPP